MEWAILYILAFKDETEIDTECRTMIAANYGEEFADAVIKDIKSHKVDYDTYAFWTNSASEWAGRGKCTTLMRAKCREDNYATEEALYEANPDIKQQVDEYVASKQQMYAGRVSKDMYFAKLRYPRWEQENYHKVMRMLPYKVFESYLED